MNNKGSELQNFSAEQLSLLEKEIRTNNGILQGKRVTELLTEKEISLDTLLNALLPIAAGFACTPISNFFVGAITVGGSGNLYCGANLEFKNQALSFSLHAEQSAISNAWLHGEESIQKIAINEAPCGYCRQFMNELVCADELDILLHGESLNFGLFLPKAFGPKDLGIEDRLLRKTVKSLKSLQNEEIDKNLLVHLQASYVPYTKNYSACMIETFDGAKFYGRYAENAAYNPSLSPIQASISQLILGGYCFDKDTIKKVTLVEYSEIENQLAVTKAVLSSYDFDVPFSYILVK